MKRILITLLALALAGAGLYRYDVARVKAAQEALNRDVAAAAREVAGRYSTDVHLDLLSECAPAMKVSVDGVTFGVLSKSKPEASKPYTIHMYNPNTPLPPLGDLVVAVAPCYLAGTSVAAMEPVPPADPVGVVRPRLNGPYRAVKVAVTSGKATDTVRVAVEARAGLLGRHVIRAEADAKNTQYLVPQASVVAALGRMWQPVVDEVYRALGSEPPATPVNTATPTPDAPAKRKPVNPPTGMTAETLATQGLGLPPEVASGKMTLSAWCKESGNAAHPWCKWWRGE